MTISQISFGAKQRFEYTKPRVKCDSKVTHPTLEKAIARYSEKQKLDIMVQEAQNALGAVSTIKNASVRILQNSEKVVEKSDEVQQKAQALIEQIVDTGAYQQFCVDLRNKRQPLASSYIAKIKVGKNEFYDIKITPVKITATKNVNSNPYQAPIVPSLKNDAMIETKGKDIFEFDAQTRELIYCAQGVKKQGYVTSIDEEYFYNDGFLSKFNLDVSKGDFNLINQTFKFEDDFLTSFSSKILETKGKTTIDRHFEYNPVGVLSRFSRGYAMDDLDTIERELEYSFSNGELKTFRKDFVESPSYWGSKIFAQFENENDFYVEANSDSNDSVGYKGICFYKNGKIEGSVVQ